MTKHEVADTGARGETARSAVVKTVAGDLRGKYANGVYTFNGVRYGEDTSVRRFLPAEPVRPWQGVRDALAFGHQCFQPATPDFELLGSGWDQPSPSSEDCLFLNIWTPGINDDRRRPVLFNLHGGGWTVGNGNSAGRSGEMFARHHDVVRVNVNHRLGIYGHTYLADVLGAEYADSGNAGILDVVLALRWVRDNIAEFGGDPENVTIFGVSGGGQKVSALMAMPEAQGLFHKASIESGPMLTATLPDAAQTATEGLLSALAIQPGQALELLNLSGEALLGGYMKMYPDGGLGRAVTGPVVDGSNLPCHPCEPAAPELSSDIPLLIGTTATEMSLFLGVADPSVFNLNWEGLAQRLPLMLPHLGPDGVQEAIADARQFMPGATPTHIFFVLISEALMRSVSIRQAERAAQRRAPVYMWLLEWNTPVDGGKWYSPHGMTVPLVMDTVANVPSMFGEKIAEAQVMARRMSGAWAQFARTGVPGHADLPPWPAYEAEKRKTMIFDTACRVADDPHSGFRRMFAPVAPSA